MPRLHARLNTLERAQALTRTPAAGIESLPERLRELARDQEAWLVVKALAGGAAWYTYPAGTFSYRRAVECEPEETPPGAETLTAEDIELLTRAGVRVIRIEYERKWRAALEEPEETPSETRAPAPGTMAAKLAKLLGA
jgi:hypothetical protein